MAALCTALLVGSALPAPHTGALEPHSASATVHAKSGGGGGARALSLAGGVSLPMLSMNTADLSAEQVERAIELGLSLGLRSVDFHLGSTEPGAREREGVGRVIASRGRDALFLITKLDKPPANMTDPAAAAALARSTLESELAALGGDGTVDMLLLKDSSSCAVMRAQWEVLEEALAAGRTRALGTYNFCAFSLDCLLTANGGLPAVRTPPAMNFLMRHVGMGPDVNGLIAYGAARGVRTAAYGTLGEPIALPELLASPTLQRVARRHNQTVESVAVRWNVQAGYAISSRLTADFAPSNTPTGARCTADCAAALRAMANVHDWALTDADMAALDALRLDQPPQAPTYYSSAGCPGGFADATVDHPTLSACANSTSASSWC